MNKIKTREEISSRDQWKIDLIYPNEQEFFNDLDRVEKDIEQLSSFSQRFLDNSRLFCQFFLQDEEICRTLEKLSVYANCKSDEDKGNSVYQTLVGKVVNLYAFYEEKTAFVVPQILKEDKAKIYQYIQEQKDLKSYQYFFEKLLEQKSHVLDEKIEKVISMYGPVLSAGEEISSYLTDADLDFGSIQDEQGQTVPLSEANYSIYIQSKDREVRRSAFSRLYEVYGGVKNTLTAAYQAVVQKDVITSKLRNYENSLSLYLNPKHIPIVLYQNLIEVVRDNLSSLYDYYQLKKEILNVSEFHLYDSYVRIANPDSNRKYSFSEAQDIVLCALSVLGEDYTNQLKRAFSEGWIDKYPNKGKKSGAYSTGSFDTIPYVLLNYTGTYTDVSTLAHELGHSMHTYYTNQNNPYITANYPIFLAEIASTTNELLLNHYMYEHASSKEEKLSILNEKLDLFKATLFRQTMFCEFEWKAHQYVENKNVLTSDYLCDLYYQLNLDYFGEQVVVDDEIRYEWLRIPHFYTPFYVYQYATSLAISCYICERLIQDTSGFREKYIQFLSSGGRDYPLEVLKIIDIDLTDKLVFERAIHSFVTTVEEFRKIYSEE